MRKRALYQAAKQEYQKSLDDLRGEILRSYLDAVSDIRDYSGRA